MRIAHVNVTVTDLCKSPGGARDRQLVFGEEFYFLEIYEGWVFGTTLRDHPDFYVGYVYVNDLDMTPRSLTHWVNTRATHIYPRSDFKDRELASLSFGSKLQVLGGVNRFYQTPQGYVPRAHVVELVDLFVDPVSVAELLLGTPYLWGGNSAFGIDCSGLVQGACRACGIPCPADSDQQEAELGQTLAEDAPLRRGDVIFWKGHVGWIAGDNLLLHANAYHMAVTYEPLDAAIARIAAQGDGPVTRRARLEETTDG